MRALATVFALFCSLPLPAEPLAPEAVPEPLGPWIDWVLHEHTDMACPVRHAQDSRDCVWPGELSIDTTASGALFEQAVTVYRKSRVRLPGDLQAWPEQVYADQTAMPVIAQAGMPVIELPPGEHRVRGMIDWQRMPEATAIAPASVSCAIGATAPRCGCRSYAMASCGCVTALPAPRPRHLKTASAWRSTGWSRTVTRPRWSPISRSRSRDASASWCWAVPCSNG